jgi:hypothetical protein
VAQALLLGRLVEPAGQEKCIRPGDEIVAIGWRARLSGAMFVAIIARPVEAQ